MVTLDGLVPKDQLLHKMDAVIDFSVIPDHWLVSIALKTVVWGLIRRWLFKALFIGYLFGIRSERQLVRKIKVNVT